MHKFYFWSDILNQMFNDEVGFDSQFNMWEEYIASQCQYIIDNEYYRFLSLNIARTGSPNCNIISPEDSKPYFLNKQRFGSQGDSFINNIIQQENNFILNVLQNEYKLWNRIKNLFSKKGLNFIEIKQFYEDDVLDYFKTKTLVSYNPYNSIKYIETPINEISASKKLSYSVDSLDAIINTIKI